MFSRLVKITVIIVWSLMPLQAFSDAMQERRVTISASIFPRLIAVDLELLEKLDDSESVKLGLVYHSDIEQAKKVEKLISRKIKIIAGKNIIVEYIDMNSLDQYKAKPLSGIFLAQSLSESDIKKVIKFSNVKNILSFSPFEGDVERGIISGIFVGAKIRPYFNIKSLNEAGVKLKPELLKVSKTYE